MSRELKQAIDRMVTEIEAFNTFAKAEAQYHTVEIRSALSSAHSKLLIFRATAPSSPEDELIPTP